MSYSISPLITECERIVVETIKAFNLDVKPEEIVITIQSAGRRNALGWFAWDRWQIKNPAAVHEINLCAEHLTTHDMGEVLIHEMAHAENHKKGIKDVSGNQCHNKKFKEMAERLGLIVKPRDKRYGYGFTARGPAADAFLKKVGFKQELFSAARLITKGIGAGSRLIKCQCPACEYTVRTTKKWIDVGVPTCPCGKLMEVKE